MRTTYTIQVSYEIAEHWREWRPLAELADEMKIETHPDGTAEMLLRWNVKAERS